MAWNTSTNAGQAGDAANHVLRLIRDGVAASPANSPAAADGDCPGLYKLAATAAEMTVDAVTLHGRSATANVVIIPRHIITEHGLLDGSISGVAGAVWAYGSRTLTAGQAGGGGAIAAASAGVPRALPRSPIVTTGLVPLRSGVVLAARVRGNGGQLITQASMASITYSIRNLTTATTVASGQSLTVASVVYDGLVQNDPRWTKDSAAYPGDDGTFGFNFLTVIPASGFITYTVDTNTNAVTSHRFRVDVTFQGAGGAQPFVLPFEFTGVATYNT